MELRAVRYETAAGVATITLNRPERLNAWTGRMAAEYRWCMATADADPDVRVIVVTGAGRAFCAGGDMRGLDRMADAGAYDPGRDPAAEELVPGAGVRADFEHEHTFPLGLAKPVIAAVNGAAAGVGLILMAFCDIRFAAAGAKITTSFGRLGIPAEHGVSWILPRLIGTARAADLLFSARVVLAEEAAEMGLVNRVVPPDELLPFTLEYAQRMAAGVSPAALLAMKRQLYAELFRSLDESVRDAERRTDEMMAQADFREGVSAFAEKRQPRFAPLPPRHA